MHDEGIGLGQRTGRKQHALLLQADHVFEVARQMLGDLFGRRAALGEDDVELFTKHGLGELADALLRHRVPPLRAAYRAPLSPCTAASMARRPAAIKDRARGLAHSMPLFSCKQQKKNRRPGTTWRRWLSRKLQDDHGKCARPAPRGSARIAVHNRTREDENRK